MYLIKIRKAYNLFFYQTRCIYMKYNLYKIGNKIRKIREEAAITQETLAGDFHISRNTLSKIENGEEKDSRPQLTLEFLLKFSKRFNCDIGYLLGEYDESKQEAHEICSATGLSENALYKIQKEKNNLCIENLNQIIINEDFWEILSYFFQYRNVSKEVFEQNKKDSKLFWESIKNADNEGQAEAYKRASIALDKRKYDYDMNRYKCQLLFEKILDKFLPKV